MSSSSSSSSSTSTSTSHVAPALNYDQTSTIAIGNKLQLLYVEKSQQLIWKASSDAQYNVQRLANIVVSIQFFENELDQRCAVADDHIQFSINDNQDVDKELRFLHTMRVLLVHLPKLFLDGVEARWDAVRSDPNIVSVGNCRPATFNVLKQLTLGEMIKTVCAKSFNQHDWILDRASHNHFRENDVKSTIQSGDLNQYDLCLAGFVVTGFAKSLFNRQRNKNGFKLFVEPALDCRNLVAHGRKAGIDRATYTTFYQKVTNVSQRVRQWLLPSLGVARANAIRQTFEISRNKLPETRTDRDALLRDKKQLLQSLDNLLSVVARLENLAQLDAALNRWNDVVLLGHDNDVCELLKLQVKTLKEDETMKDAFRGPELDDSSNGVTRSLLHAAEQHHLEKHGAYQRFFAIRPSLRKWYPFTIYFSLPKRKSDEEAAKERRVIARGGFDTSLRKASIELDRRTKTQFRVIRLDKQSDVRELVGWQSSVSACLSAFMSKVDVTPLDATQLVAPLDALYGWDDDDEDENVNDNNSNK